MGIIRTENLSHSYGAAFKQSAIDCVNIDIEKGGFVGVIGHTGSGKSTLVQHFNGLLKPGSGKVFINGEDMWAKPKEIRKYRFQVGLVFQYPEYQLFEETVYKDIAFGPKNMGLSKEEIESRVYAAAKIVGIGEKHMKASPFELSGGQKRRVAIAGVLAMDPEVLILDEPTAGLDPRGRDMILNEIAKYHEEKKNTVLLVSHSMEDVAKYCKKVLVMNKAQAFMYGDVKEVFKKAPELLKMGLSVPQITSICMELKKRGYDISPDTYTVDSAKEQLLRLLGACKSGDTIC